MRKWMTDKLFLYHWVRISILLFIYDIIVMNVSYGLALWLRFDFRFSDIPYDYLTTWVKYIPIHTACTLILMFAFKLYRSMWRFASFDELSRTSIVCAISMALHIVGTTVVFQRMPISYYVMGGILQYILIAGIRFSYRIFRMLKIRTTAASVSREIKNTMIIGAGEAGRAIISEFNKSGDKMHTKICCIIDDNKNKKNRYIDGIPIVGTREDIPQMVKKYQIQKIIFAIPTISASEKKKILEICKETGCEMQIVPAVYQLVNGEVKVSSIRPVEIEELLGRESIRMDLAEISAYVKDKIVLVTGGGGSIGSELCRQIAAYGAKQLIIFDIYENNAYDIEQELRRKYPSMNLVALIGSVRDTGCLEKVFSTYHPQLIFHAAAHKHVPLMETSPNEAIKNNVFGTYNTARFANEYGAEKFVLISTDKAVNPTNIMGASKRMCEMVIQMMSRHSKGTTFAAVRFGNVLGSNGSVIPLFKRQIAEGGPVTVTHPDIIRYFMTIPEAVSLVLTAGSYAEGGEIFVLDMGEPVKILDLATNLIKLSGLKPGVDIEIKFTGLRPGEKLYEELLMAEEGLHKTDNNLIFIGEPIDMDDDRFLMQLAELKDACYKEVTDVKERVSEIVTTYRYKKED